MPDTLQVRDIFADLPAVETQRLLLRKMTLADADDMFRYASDPDVARFTTWEPHRSIDETRRFLEDALDAYAAGDVRNWGVVHKDDRRFIGTAGFLYWNVDVARAEIGYAMSREYWGRGLMTEAVEAIIRFGFERMRLNRIEARCDALNIGSARVMEKAGMQHEGTLRQWFVAEGEYRDMKLYAILRQEWPG